MLKTVTLSDGGPCEVRVLGLYELDAVAFDDPGEFEYDYQISSLTNQITKKRYTLRDFDPGGPERPTVPKELCTGDSYEDEWERARWDSYDLYQAVLQRRYEQIEASERHAHDVGRYVIRECLAEGDRGRVRLPGDLEAVMGAALVAEETAEDLARAMAITFQIDLGWPAYPGGA